MFELVYTIVFLVIFVGLVPILFYFLIKEYKKEKKEKEFLLNTLSAINKDINYIRKEIENVSKEM